MFELTFPGQFPNEPPFIRVVRPIFQFRTGHITIGGSICMESITPKGWIATRSIESVFVEILMVVLTGGGRLDLNRKGQEYSF